VRRRPVALERDLLAAALHSALRQAGVEVGGPDEAVRELPVDLRDEAVGHFLGAGLADPQAIQLADGD